MDAVARVLPRVSPLRSLICAQPSVEDVVSLLLVGSARG